MQLEQKTTKQLRHDRGLFTVVEVAQEIGVSREVIDYHAKHGRCVAPTVQINELPRKYYTADDVLSLAQYFARRGKHERQPVNGSAANNREKMK